MIPAFIRLFSLACESTGHVLVTLAMTHLWKSEDDFVELVAFQRDMGLGIQLRLLVNEPFHWPTAILWVKKWK